MAAHSVPCQRTTSNMYNAERWQRPLKCRYQDQIHSWIQLTYTLKYRRQLSVPVGGWCLVNQHTTALMMGESAGHLTVPFLAELHLENAARQVSCISHSTQEIYAAGHWYECNLPYKKPKKPEQNKEKTQGLDFVHFNFFFVENLLFQKQIAFPI